MRVVKRVIILCGIAAFVIVGGFFLDFVLIPVLSPYASARVPQSCIDRDRRAHPASPIVMASDATAKIVLTGDTLQLVRKSDGVAVRTLHFQNDIVAATLHDGVAYIFNDAIGYFLNESTGAPVDNFLETDNYRINEISKDATSVQTDVEISAIRPGRAPLSHLHLNFSTYAYGCRLH
jgi:hypothetical protein